jgi:uncharacterized protein YhjY with autotransporter beta-barrel domain
MKTTEGSHPLKQDIALCLVVVLYVIALPQVQAQAQPRTLNNAVIDQLDFGPDPDGNFIACDELLDGDDPGVVLDPASGLSEICARQENVIDARQPSSSGGLAATPPSQPSSVESRLEEEEEEGEIRRGFFASVGYESLDKEISTFEDGYNSDIVRLAAGFDMLIGGAWVIGVVADGSQQSGDFVGDGDFESVTYGITGFGSYWIGEAGSFDFYAGYANQSHDRVRHATFTDPNAQSADDFEQPFTAEGDPAADFDGAQVLLGVSFSYDWSVDNVTFGPRITWDYVETDYEKYAENDPENSGLALTFYDDSEASSIFSAGLAGSVALSTSFGVVVIEQNLGYRYETGMDQRNVEVSFVGDLRDKRFTYLTETPDRDFLQYSFVTRFLLANNWEWMLEYAGIASHRYLSRDAVVLGFRKGF